MLLSYISIFANSVIGFIYIPILLHYMTQQEYGLYRLMGSIITYFVVIDFGLSTIVMRFYGKYKVAKDQLKCENVLAILLRMFISCCFLVVIIGTV